MPQSALPPFRLKPWFSPRPWGRRSLEPWYSAAQTGASEPVGEAWLTGPDCIAETGPLAGKTLASIAHSHAAQLLGAVDTQPAEFPLLVKLLFPADKLSVQVHPDDAHARSLGQPRGKTECWYVLAADPGAQIALGFNSTADATPDAVRAAIAAGTLEDLLNWVPVAPGDMVFVDAGTVHAIGPGMVLLETQQTCDITFRMYDYGRPRELHIDKALRVMKTHTAAGKVAPQKMRASEMESGAPSKLRVGGIETATDFTRLIQQQYFTVDRYDLAANSEVTIDADKPGCLVALSGDATVSGCPVGVVAADCTSPIDALPGQAIILPATTGDLTVSSTTGAAFVHCWAP